jgi:outer membrane protein assembly factor BamB
VIYLPSGATGLVAIRDGGNVGETVWETSLPATLTTPVMVWLDTLFVGAGEGTAARLLALDRSDPDKRSEFSLPAARVQLPAVGGETVFVGADRLWALDANLLEAGEEVVWTSTDVFTVTVPPVYGSMQWSRTLSAPLVGGPLAAPDLLLAVSEDGKLWVLDADDGSVIDASASLPVQPVGGPATDGQRVYVPAVDGSLYAYETEP